MVDTDTDTVPGGSNGWTVEFTTTTTTVYTTTTIQEWVVTGMDCINQGGNIVGGWDWATPEEGNPNCVAAYQDETRSNAGFTIVEDGHWQTTVERDVSSMSTTERTGCWNPGGQPQDLSHQHCQVEAP